MYAAKRQEEEHLAVQVSVIALISAADGLAVITRQPGRNHQPASLDNEDFSCVEGRS